MGSRLVLSDSIWIVGPSRSGKTARLVEQFCIWFQNKPDKQGQFSDRRQMPNSQEKYGNGTAMPLQRLNMQQTEPAVLVLAANDDNRRELSDRIVAATQGKYPIRAKTPLGFFQDEVILFWPLLIQLLNLKAQFPVRLRPETEQELATHLWRPHLDTDIWRSKGVSENRLVRRILDLLQLSAYSGTQIEEISGLLDGGEGVMGGGGDGVMGSGVETRNFASVQWEVESQLIVSLLQNWRSWCLERGLLTYGIITELYCQHLLPDQNYQRHLNRRYQLVMADDVDDYPAIARHLFDFLLDSGAIGAFTYNPDGAVRLGLGADPTYLEGIAARCQVENLTQPPLSCLCANLATPIEELLTDPVMLLTLPETVQSIQTTSRAALLRQTASEIVRAIQSGQVEPSDVAVIAPGLDAIARYTLVEILSKQGIPVAPLNDQLPLTSSPTIRALLTILALVYPGLGRLVDRDAIAEMLVVLSKGVDIDPVRAGLLADYCFEPHPDRPNLLSVTAYDRRDRLGYAATTAYEEILQWLEIQRSQQEQRLLPSPISLLDRAIQKFLWKGNNLPYDQLAALRELLETAQHYWEVDARLRQIERSQAGVGHSQAEPGNELASADNTIAQFIQLLRRGTITANPYPVRPIGPASRAVTLATIFQYRSSRRFHRWQFWLDAGSSLWLSGGSATLFGAPLFLHDRFGRPWTAESELNANQERLQRILRDLLGRAGERVYLCHSDLAVNGQEQAGPLLSLINASIPLTELGARG